MITPYIQVGTFVKTLKNLPWYGKIVGENGKKKWTVEFNGGTTEKNLTSGRLRIVEVADNDELPASFLNHFRLLAVTKSNKR